MVTRSDLDRQMPAEPQYLGVRCTADEYLALPDDGFWYQLIDGVVLMSPKPTPRHQDLLAELVFQLKSHLRKAGSGRVLPEVDLRLGADLVYSPDVAFLRSSDRVDPSRALNVVPDLVVEIVSPSSRRMDLKTKRADYERFGVREYWVVEPDEKRLRVFRLRDGAYQESVVDGPTAPSEVIPGFAFDVPALWAAMHA